ncbi:hypothetical protein [Stella sp.]|uniref:hypothetical protein n=1 Tax=Stella sp. TaxID=2912054 RepID=UPI0035B1ACE8
MPVRYAPGRWAATWLALLDRLFWLPTRLLARLAGTAGGEAAGGPARPVNDNLAVLSARPANTNIPRRLA